MIYNKSKKNYKNKSIKTKKNIKRDTNIKNINHNINLSNIKILKLIEKLYTENANVYLLLLHPIFLNVNKFNITSRNNILKELKKHTIFKKTINLSKKQALGLNYNINILQNKTKYSLCLNQIKNQGYVSSSNKSSINNKLNNKMQVLILKDIELEAIKCLFTDTNIRTILSGKLMYDVSKTIFNSNSLLFLEYQLLERFIKKTSKQTLKTLMEYKKYLENNIDIRDYNKFMILGGNVLSVYGLRVSTDLDLIISNNDKPYTKDFINIIEKDFINKNRDNKKWDVIHPKLKWKPIYKTFHKEWASSVGANSIIECIHNPKYHFYFLGLKFIILDLEIYRRNIRNRPAAIADLIAINELLLTNKDKKIKINAISRNYIYILDNEIKYVYTKNIDFIKTVKYNLKTKYNITLSLSKIYKMLKFNN